MRKLILILSAIVLSVNLFASDIPARPNPPTLVTDYANILSENDKAQLERKLVDFFANTSTQITVVTIPDLAGTQISDMAFKIGQEWGIGNEKFDNGILVLIKPKTSESKGEAFIAVGYGLEGAVPDATAKQIVENEMIPSFKAGDMFGGIENATNVLIDITKGEYNYKQYAKKVKGGFNPFLILIVLFVIFSLFRGKRGTYTAGSRNSNLPFWIGLGLLSNVGNRHSGLFNDFSSGSGSFGGGDSFGGFGGFGGGGFGGGGAGGSW